MLNEISVENLRSVKGATIEVSPVTLLYGPNGSGKSTMMHALAILKNIVSRPTLQTHEFFDLGFAEFGGFEDVVFGHDTRARIRLAVGHRCSEFRIQYGVSLTRNTGRFELAVQDPGQAYVEDNVSFPYYGGEGRGGSAPLQYGETTVTVRLRGPRADAFGDGKGRGFADWCDRLNKCLKEPMESLNKTVFVHLRRGFSLPHYARRSGRAIVEDATAKSLANDPGLEEEVARNLGEVFDRDFRVSDVPAKDLFFLRTSEGVNGFWTDVVNDGSGVSQVLYLLAMALRQDVSCVCIEEPEIHLHPRACRRLANVLLALAKEKSKTLIISTHSEHFVMALLAAASRGDLKPDDAACYLSTKEHGESKFERQRLNSQGQIEGGLSSFMEGELEDLKEILGLSGKGD